MPTESLRLQSLLSQSGIGSRRGVVDVIRAGRVKVNHKVIMEPGFRLQHSDLVEVDNVLVNTQKPRIYLALNKPPGLLCTNNDEKGRAIAVDLFSEDLRSQGLHHVGRLDQFSEGLIFYTNDGHWTRRITHASSQIPKVYVVTGITEIPQLLIQYFSQGIQIDNIFYKAKKIIRLTPKQIEITLIEGKNREIRNVFDHFQIKVQKLIRTQIGKIRLQNLGSGKYRHLTTLEVRSFYEEDLGDIT